MSKEWLWRTAALRQTEAVDPVGHQPARHVQQARAYLYSVSEHIQHC